MRKKLFAVLLTAMCFFCAFSLVGCTDKKDEPRKLTTIERQICGEWGGEPNNPRLTFKYDGTVEERGNGTWTFREVEHNTSEEYGDWYKIELKSKTNAKYYYYYYPKYDYLYGGSPLYQDPNTRAHLTRTAY